MNQDVLQRVLKVSFGHYGIDVAAAGATREDLDSLLVAQLMELSEGQESSFAYLLGCYDRAQLESRNLSPRQPDVQQSQEALAAVQELCVSYAGLLLRDLFPQADVKHRERQLAHSLIQSLGAPPLPSGFLEALCQRFAGDSLEDILLPAVEAMRERLIFSSLLGEIVPLLGAMHRIFSIPAAAQALTSHSTWLPQLQAGRDAEGKTLIGPAFAPTMIPDPVVPQQPSVRTECYAHAEDRPTELRAAAQSLQVTAASMQQSLHQLAMLLLKPKATREPMLQFLAACLNSNKERDKLQPDVRVAASHGFMVNLLAVLLHACQPFLQDHSIAWGKLDPNYMSQNRRLELQEETRLNLEAEEQAQLQERQASGSQASAAPHFICETFFLAARATHLGYVKIIADVHHTSQRFHHLEGHMQEVDAAVQSYAGTPMQAQANATKARLQQMISEAKQDLIAYNTALTEPALLRMTLAFVRLMAAWLLRLASPPCAAGQAVQLPLPTPASVEFRALPEFFVEDIAEILLYVGRTAPAQLDGSSLQGIVMFLIVFVASPHHIRNPYLRSKLAEVLYTFLPREDEEQDGLGRGRRRQLGVSSAMLDMFHVEPLVQQHMVSSLIQLYVDMEHTGRNAAFYEKFSTRHMIGQILQYLWQIPAHQEAWVKLSSGNARLYEQFCHFLETDSIHLLDEAMKLLPEVQEAEKALGDEAQPQQGLSQQQRQERQDSLRQNRRMIRSDLDLANMAVAIMQFSTQRITAPWLSPTTAQRIAGMLNYFLEHLTGPSRRKLKINNPERYHWNPLQLLRQICSIYVQLLQGDAQGELARCIAADARCYRPGMFDEAAQVLQKHTMSDYGLLNELRELGTRVAAAGEAARADEEAAEDAPDEFKDPILDHIMLDPVTLPSSKIVIDRGTIMRHLLSDPHDPFNRQPLSEKDLITNSELKSKIMEWKQQQH